MKTILLSLLCLPFLLQAQLPFRIDSTFATNGVALFDLADQDPDISLGIGVQSDQKIILAGYAGIGGPNRMLMSLIRLHPDGTLDTSFGQGGLAKKDLWDYDVVWAMAIQPDDKIVIVGHASYRQERPWKNRFLVARFTADGQADASFGDDGVRIVEIGEKSDYAYDVAIQPDGKILVLGRAHGVWLESGWALVRLLPDGSLDPDFANQGKFYNNNNVLTAGGFAVTLQKDGKILIGGYEEEIDGEFEARVMQLLPDGSIDATFGNQGTAHLHRGTVQNMKIDQQGRIVCAIYERPSASVTARLLPSGQLDPSFGSGGITKFDKGGAVYNPVYNTVEILPSGQLLGIGSRQITGVDARVMTFLLMDKDGHVDTSFGQDGMQEYPICQYALRKVDSHLLPDGSLLTTGSCIHDANSSWDYLATKFVFQDKISNTDLAQVSFAPFPNPTTGSIHLHVPDQLMGEKITITDAFGRTVVNVVATQQEYQFELPGKGSGIYLMKIKDRVQKIMVLE